MVNNYLSGFFDFIRTFLQPAQLTYITEPVNWSIRQDGHYIVSSLNQSGKIRATYSTNLLGLRRTIVHFGSLNMLLSSNKVRKVHPSNATLATIFHLNPNDPRLPFILPASTNLRKLHTSNTLTKRQLVILGIPETMISVIPLGVDVSLFRPATTTEIKAKKKQLGLPLDRLIIGSFQKDGNGWHKGSTPKLIKGPDIFIQSVTRLARHLPLHVLLVGPARGYVETALSQNHIPFTSIGFLPNFRTVAQFYHALDVYFITSRVEGGPKQILECWASGVPVISTPVGMVPDISVHKQNILITKEFSPTEIASLALHLYHHKSLAISLAHSGLNQARQFSWDIIAQRYFNELYAPILKDYGKNVQT